MKKFLVVLLSLGLIVAFGATASALDVKFSGQYYVVGVYDNNDTLEDSTTTSRAMFFQRFRLQSDFKVAEGLTMTARFDALEKQWGQSDWFGSQDRTNSRGAYPKYGGNVQGSPGTVPATGSATNGGVTGGYNRSAQENIEFERAYVTFNTAIGQFQVGYQAADQWGTVFGDSENSRPRIVYATQLGPLTLLGIYEKVFEADTSNETATGVAVGTASYIGKTDADNDNYALAGIYNFKGGETGLLLRYYAYNSNRIQATPFKTKQTLVSPYMKATFGPVYVEAEVNYLFGKASEYENGAAVDVDRSAWSAYAKAKVNVGPAYFGGQIGWVKGDGDDRNTNTSGLIGGNDWKPTLILMNVDTHTYKPLPSASATAQTVGNTYNYEKTDAKGLLLYNIFGGVNPTPKLNVEANLSFAKFDTKKAWNTTRTTQTELQSDSIGTEFDVTATYKLYDNLTYMVGAGYLWSGDAFKGTISAPTMSTVGNDYLLMNKLTLNF
ncbi:MAG: hypothetical protein NT047_14700 [Deltaproteobacteria bacterium]|nr:hypothetical protein [Deltaproteobacteria bacterium]